MSTKPTTPNIDEAIRIARTLIDTKDIIKKDPENDITMQLAEALKVLSELQAGDGE